MSREDADTKYLLRMMPEVVELGIDHNNEKQWYMATREGWQEVGKGNLVISGEHYRVGTRIELSEPVTEDDLS